MNYIVRVKLSILPKEILKLTKLVIKTSEYLEQCNGNKPTSLEIASYLKIDAGLVNEVLFNLSNTISLDEELVNDNNLYNIVSRSNDNIDFYLDLEEIIDNLESPDKEIITLKFFGNYTQEELANKFNMSQVGVSRLISKSLKKIKQTLSV